MWGSSGRPTATTFERRQLRQRRCGCILAFLVIGAIFLMIGGSVYIDAGGVVLQFVIGGIIGLIVNWIYQRGRRDAERRPPTD